MGSKIIIWTFQENLNKEMCEKNTHNYIMTKMDKSNKNIKCDSV